MTEESVPPAAQTRGRLTLDQLRGFEWGIAATIMPVSDGWRVHYFSVPDFDAEPGGTYSSFETALVAIRDILPVVNSEEERARALNELERRSGEAGLEEGEERHP